MKANEFRIGNYAQDQNGNLLKVCELNDEGKIIFSVVDRSKFPLPDGWQAQPILLSRVSVEKIGLKFSASLGLWGMKESASTCEPFDFEDSLYCNVHLYWSEHGGVSIEVSNEHGEYAMMNLAKIKTVHKLQNAWHGLTGKEIEWHEAPKP